jgi:hypothetical protein
MQLHGHHILKDDSEGYGVKKTLKMLFSFIERRLSRVTMGSIQVWCFYSKGNKDLNIQRNAAESKKWYRKVVKRARGSKEEN